MTRRWNRKAKPQVKLSRPKTFDTRELQHCLSQSHQRFAQGRLHFLVRINTKGYMTVDFVLLSCPGASDRKTALETEYTHLKSLHLSSDRIQTMNLFRFSEQCGVPSRCAKFQ